MIFGYHEHSIVLGHFACFVILLVKISSFNLQSFPDLSVDISSTVLLFYKKKLQGVHYSCLIVLAIRKEDIVTFVV